MIGAALPFRLFRAPTGRSSNARWFFAPLVSPVPLRMTAAAAIAPLAASAQGTAPDSAGYFTRLGTDTLAIERFVRTAACRGR
jgi:hypothetical protein